MSGFWEWIQKALIAESKGQYLRVSMFQKGPQEHLCDSVELLREDSKDVAIAITFRFLKTYQMEKPSDLNAPVRETKD